jgi:hypothetical protein
VAAAVVEEMVGKHWRREKERVVVVSAAVAVAAAVLPSLADNQNCLVLQVGSPIGRFSGLAGL